MKSDRFSLSHIGLYAGALLLAASVLGFSCSNPKDAGTPATSTKFQQYYVHDEKLYVQHCSNCHQKNGAGLGLLFPPLNTSDFMDNHLEAVLCLMRHGINGELTVNGKSFNKEMPPQPALTDIEIAEIATYIYNSWDHQRGIIDVQDVSRALLKCDPVKTN